LPVRPAPTEEKGSSSTASDIEQATEKTPSPKPVKQHKQSNHQLPTGVIVVTILVMIALCALAVWLYLQSRHAVAVGTPVR